MPTNADLQRHIDDLARHVDAVEKLTASRADALEERMKTYEKQTAENTLILKRVEETVNNYETTIKNFLDFLRSLLKWTAGIAAIVIAGLIIAYFTANVIR